MFSEIDHRTVAVVAHGTYINEPETAVLATALGEPADAVRLSNANPVWWEVLGNGRSSMPVSERLARHVLNATESLHQRSTH